MAGMLPGSSSVQGNVESGLYNHPHDRTEKHACIGPSWYFTRKEIEENLPSRRDGIDLKKESYLRKSYCTFLQDLGMRLKVPQVTIATAIIFCHRFFLRQSHAKNDRRTIATVCMFLAGKVEETPRPLKDVIIVSYEIINKKDPVAVQRIKQQREVYEEQKELILLGEHVVLATLGFDLNVHHPYKPLVEAIKKFKVAQNALAQVAWNFVNDGLRTSLCLQFKPHHIAAGAIFLAAKFLKVKLPSDGEKVWWQEFDVTPRQLEDVSNQMLELYEQNRAAPGSTGNEEGNSAGASSNHAPSKPHTSAPEPDARNGYPQAAGPTSSKLGNPATFTERKISNPKATQNDGNDHSGREHRSANWEHGNLDNSSRDQRYHQGSGMDAEPAHCRTSHGLERRTEYPTRVDAATKVEGNERNAAYGDGTKGQSPVDAIKNFDKVKAALEKRRKAPKSDVSKKSDVLDDDDLIERELEDGIELAVEDEKSKQERRQSNGHVRESEAHREAASDGPNLELPGLGKRKRKHSSPNGQIDARDAYDAPHRHQLPCKHPRDVDDVAMVRSHDQEWGNRNYG